MPILLSYLPSPVARGRLQAALQVERAARVPYETLHGGAWSECHALAARCAPQVLVFDPYGATGMQLDAALAFRAEFPSASMVPYGAFQRRPARDVLVLARELGVQRIVTLDVDDGPATLRLTLAEAQSAGPVGRVLAALEAATPAELVPLLRIILHRAHAPVTPEEVAHAFHRHCKTIREELRGAGFPSLNKLIVWGRLFHASVLLQDRSRSLESVAMALHFPSAPALHNQFVRYAGERVRRVVQERGADALVDVFLDRIARNDWELCEPRRALQLAGA
jgi:AraC-like DNA-binding protein